MLFSFDTCNLAVVVVVGVDAAFMGVVDFAVVVCGANFRWCRHCRPVD